MELRPWTEGGSNDTLLEGLTEPQREAVLQTEGPLLVLAAAGSGKTRVITRRIARLVGLGVAPWQILALTFTNKAAGEMRERVGALLGGPVGVADSPRAVRGLTVTTFHALCARLLRRYAEAARLKPDFTIYDSDDQSSLCKKAVEACQLSTANFPPRSVLSAISRAKNQLLDADAFAARAMDFSAKSVARVYKAYESGLRKANAVDFDDLLLLTARTLQNDKSVRAECQARWRYLLIDEYQDTNHAQLVIASMIAGEPGGKPNICVVGDPDQSIYGWRGADIANILEFEEQFPGCRVITLGENFRSTAPVLRAADELIRHNKRRKHKPLFTVKKGGELPEAVLTRDERAEAALVADWLRARGEAGVAWREMAVFYRTNSLSRVVEEALRGGGIPYTIARGTAFYDREEVRHALGYLRIVANEADSVSAERVINVPARGIGKTTLEAIAQMATERGVPLLEACRAVGEVPGLAAKSATAVSKFVAMRDAWTGGGTFLGADVSHTLAELVDRVIRESGLRGMYVEQAKTSQSESDEQRVDNLDELVSSAREFELEFDASADPAGAGGDAATPPLLAMLRAYLESVALVADADAVDPERGSVTLMTLHAAKGLEFDSVAMIGMEQGMLPHSRAVTSPVAGDAELEEERRLCFVGITRAMRRLVMTAAKYRTVRGVPERTVPSQFLAEIPADAMVVSDQSEAFEHAPGWDEPARAEGAPSRGGWRTDGPRAPDRGVGVAGLGGAISGGTGTPPAFPVGSQVRHPQFGLGVVEAITAGANARATVRFKDVGVKTMVLEYARLTRV